MNWYRALRRDFVLWILERYCYPETVQLTTFGFWEIMDGDIAVVKGRSAGLDFVDIGRVVGTDVDERGAVRQVRIKIYRRPK